MANVGKGASGNTLIGKGNNSSPNFAPIGTDSGLTDGGVLIAQGNDPFTVTNAGTAGQILISNGPGVDPSFQDGGTAVGNTITGDTGGALSPTAGNWDIVSTTTNGIQTTGSGSTLTVAMATPYADGDFEFRSATSGATRTLSVTNTSDTASSQAKLTTSVAGSTAGDTWVEHAVGSARSYAQGIDNSDSDKLKLTTAAAATCNPSTATPAWSFTPGTGFNYDNSGTTGLGIGFNVDPTTNYPININKTLTDVVGINLYNPSTSASARTGINFNIDTAAYDASVLLYPDNNAVALFQKKLVLNTQSVASSDGIVLNVDTGDSSIFSVNNTEIVRVTSSGISFNAGADSLAVYDQGTWTPTLTGSTTPPDVITYSSQVGMYTRIGNVVYISGIVAVATFTLGAGAGNLTMSGLPFTINATLGAVWTVSMDGVDFSASTLGIDGQLLVNTITLRFLESKDNASSTIIPLSALAAGDTIRVTGFYFV